MAKKKAETPKFLKELDEKFPDSVSLLNELKGPYWDGQLSFTDTWYTPDGHYAYNWRVENIKVRFTKKYAVYTIMESGAPHCGWQIYEYQRYRSNDIVAVYWDSDTKKVWKKALFSYKLFDIPKSIKDGNRAECRVSLSAFECGDEWHMSNERGETYEVWVGETPKEIADGMGLLHRAERLMNHNKNVCSALIRWPELLVLYEADYKFADAALSDMDLDFDFFGKKYKMIAKSGNTPEEIFKVPKEVYEALKGESDIEKWDFIRKIYPDGGNAGEIKEFCEGFKKSELSKIQKILGKKISKKPVFELKELLDYTDRISRYQALAPEQSLKLIAEYIDSCRRLGEEPAFEGSLWRIHDAALKREREAKQAENKM